MHLKTKSKGFTLIELLVVISIIGLLSSVVLASLNTARNKAKDAAIKSAMIQFRNLLFLQYEETGSYAPLQPSASWVSSLANCDTQFDPINGTALVKQANALCRYIYSNSANDTSVGGPGDSRRFYAGINPAPALGFTYDKYFSIITYLPGAALWFCLGTSGQSLITNVQAGATTPNWLYPGCWSNP